MADLHDALAGLVVRGAHALGMVHRERHRLFLIHMLAGIERGHEMLAMQMLRRGDQHRVDRFVIQQPPIVVIRRGRREPAFFASSRRRRVNVGESREIDAGQGNGFPHQLRAAIAGADDA